MIVDLRGLEFLALHSPSWRIRDADQYVDLLSLHDGRRGQMPKVLTDKQADTAELCGVKRLNPVAGREVSLLVKQAVRRQVHLAVDMADPPALGIQPAVVIMRAAR